MERGKLGKLSDMVVDVLQVLPYNQVSTCLFTDTCDNTFSYVSSFPLCAFSIMEFLYVTPMLLEKRNSKKLYFTLCREQNSDCLCTYWSCKYFSSLFISLVKWCLSHCQQGTYAIWRANLHSGALNISRKWNSKINYILVSFQDMFYKF